MNKLFLQRIDQLARSADRDCLWGGLKGIEKESLRVDPEGMLSRRPHPQALGSPLTNRYITTDFSEALLEFVTPAMPHAWEVLRFLCDIHQFSYERLGDELLWVTSMPCQLPADEDIPLAQYGNSNVGRMKTVYRNGLGHRYGRSMQTIAGIHFNYSLPASFWPVYRRLCGFSGSSQEFQSASYLALIRNFRRFGWLILYLFGASPAVCKSFTAGATAGLQALDEHTFYAPFATSLRMSDLGYSNKTQAGLNISVNSLDEYVDDLGRAIATPDETYQRIGVKVDGAYRQLNASQLQIENEYYSSIRPKRVALSGERPTTALKRGGIEYVEIRSLDLNVFDPVGINQHAMRFVETFLVYCLLMESPSIDEAGLQEASANHSATARRGRDPDLTLQREGVAVRLTDWATEILTDVRTVAELIDGGSEACADYVQSVDVQADLVSNPDVTPSARIVQELYDGGSSFFEFAMDCARSHREYFTSLAAMATDRERQFNDEVRQSLQRQSDIEAAEDLDFDDYLADYYASA